MSVAGAAKTITHVVSAPDRPALLLAWYDRHRRNLPWRANAGERADPYREWPSQNKLQQTTAKAGGPHFQKFLGRLASGAPLPHRPPRDCFRLRAGLAPYP